MTNKTVEREELVAALWAGGYRLENDIEQVGLGIAGFRDDWGFLPNVEVDGVLYKIVPVDS